MPCSNTTIDLRLGLEDYRVVDRQAAVECPSSMAQLRIAGSTVIRKVIRAPAVIGLIQECGAGLPNLDHWQSEGHAATADDSWTMVAVYAGDVKCSASTWWNTGNPRHLVERYVIPFEPNARKRTVIGSALLDALARSFRRCSYHAADLPPGRWFQASWTSLREAIASLLPSGILMKDCSSRPGTPLKDERTMVYLMSEEGTDWVKVGTCRGNATSPPRRRRAMYQPGNRRELSVAFAWTFEGTNPEAAMKQTLRQYCRAENRSSRSEWFHIGAGRAAHLLEPVLAARNAAIA